ncbi:unnamed protein product [Spodoptera littoralis]|uniref:Ig-like domain-containing protein n=1 Tax=Spodoptera littoralis TaxID=7109 RepID=A0A9P0HW18_SPOLI|nr:unnamed protein product [Spodoptera littoralis]CAH1635037.1 unnamed protein product [Spodoptera littoralis]
MAFKGFCGEVIGFFLAVGFCIICPEYVSSAQRELGKGSPTNASATASPAGSADNAIRSGAALDGPRPTPRTGPYFDLMASKNVTALLGKTAYLNCRVKNLGNKTLNMQVSWVRHRDIHLLTVGRYTYTSDQRFRAIHLPHSEDWTLQTANFQVAINQEPTTEIIGGPDLYIDRGSTINLTCVVLYSPEPPAYIFWNHNDAIISYDSPRGGVSVVTEKGETTTSFLLIQQARPSDSGTYQCNPSNAQSKSIVVHVLNGEYPAAMQRGGQAFAPTSPTHCLVLVACLFITLS